MCTANFDQNIDVTVANIILTISRRDVQFMFHMHVVDIINMKPEVVITSTLSTDWPCPFRTGHHFWRVRLRKLLSPDSHHYLKACLRPHTTRLPALSGLTLPGKLLSPDSLLFGCFQLLIFTDLYKQQNQFGRPRIKIKNQLNPEVMSSRNEEICNLKRLAQLNFLN